MRWYIERWYGRENSEEENFHIEGGSTLEELRNEPIIRIVNDDGISIISCHDLAVIDPYIAKIITLCPIMIEALNKVYCQCPVLYPCDENCFMIEIENILKQVNKKEGE